jgi:hypothetical protein
VFGIVFANQFGFPFGSNASEFIQSIMKKILFVTLCLGCLSFMGLHAQKGNGKPTTETSEQGGGSTAKAKGVGKGSPLLQRNGAAPASSEAEAKPVETMEQPAPAPSGKAVIAPAAPAATETPVKKEEAVATPPKVSQSGVSMKPRPVAAPAKTEAPKN